MSAAKILAVDAELDFELLIKQRSRRQISPWPTNGGGTNDSFPSH
jgi:hypothetical protein